MDNYSKEHIKLATSELTSERPDLACNQGLAVWQRQALWLAPVILLLLILVSYWIPYVGLSLLSFLGLVFFSSAFLRYAPAFLITPPMRLSFKEQRSAMDYPIYTVLVPLFKEAHMVSDLVRRLEGLNWPRSRLDVKLVLEQADNETRATAQRLNLREGFEIVVVPDHPPRTKGKACNYALLSARGKFVTIFDAEDQPDPDQLLRAFHLFSTSPEQVACLQAPLVFFNHDENWLTRQFTIEYILQFMFFLPFVVRAGLPVFLGGSSNHFKTDVLRSLMMWDPYNVTEDADIGLRANRLGYQTLILPSLTKEEAVCRFGDWLKQRSRWIKGWLQTWLVAMRKPRQLLSEIGFMGFIFLQLLVPAYILSLLVHLVIWPIAIFVYFFDPFYSMLIAASIITSYLFVIMAVQFGCSRPGVGLVRGLKLAGWMVPLYWTLLGFGVCRAIWQLIKDPYHWDKTTHGLTKYKTSA